MKQTAHVANNKKRNPYTLKQVRLKTFFLLGLLFLTLGLLRETLGKFLHSFVVSDLAKVAKFDVIITAPLEFCSEQGKNVFEHRFLSDSDVVKLNFQAYNNGEVDVFCVLQISGDIQYRSFISGKEGSEFVLNAKETVSFQLVLEPDGLDTNITNASFYVDIKQVE